MNQKKITAFLLAASLLAVPMGTGVELGTCITAQAAVQSGTCGAKLTWKLENGTLTISGEGDMDNFGNEGMPGWYSYSSEIKKVVIQDGVTGIGEWAFNYCNNLTDVTIPSSVKRFGLAAFKRTPWMTAQRSKTPLVIINSILVDGMAAEGDCVIPDGVTAIADEAFRADWGTGLETSMTSVTIPDSVTSIGKGAFCECPELAEIHIPDSVTYIGSNALSYTPWMTARRSEDPLVVVNGILVDATTATGEVVVPDGVTAIAGEAFDRNKDLTAVTIPEGVTSIGDNAFVHCFYLTAARLPESLTSIGEYAFFNCQKLEDLNIPAGVSHFGQNAFSETPWLDARRLESPLVIFNNIVIDGKHVEGACSIPSGVKAIADSAFEEVTAVTEVIMPETVASIGRRAFRYCVSLRKLTVLNPVCDIYDSVETICCYYDDGPVYIGELYGYANATLEDYARKYKHNYTCLGEAPATAPTLTLGDLNGDKQVNASDAARILMASATAGVTGDTGLTAAETAAADVTKDGKVDASDAAKVLMYSAAVGTGFKGTMEEYLQ